MSRLRKYSAYTRNQTRAISFAAAFCLLTTATFSATARAEDGNSLTEAAASSLAPNEYRWDPSLAPDGPTVMVVKLDTQRAFVWRRGKLIGISTISSGKPGYDTPDGTFTVLEKQKEHHSNKYDDAPMPYMQRLTWDGLALHAGYARGRPASHGCIRLPMGFAAALFKENTRGMHVVITGHAPENGETLTADRQKSHTSEQADDLRAAQYSKERNDSNLPEQALPPDAATNGTASDNSEQPANQGQNGEQDDNSSQDLPPPPSE